MLQTPRLGAPFRLDLSRLDSGDWWADEEVVALASRVEAIVGRRNVLDVHHLLARYCDPSTVQFLTRDPVESMTGQRYQYAAGDPLDLSDSSGMCIGPGWLCRAANDVWHPARAVITAPVSVVALAGDAAASLLPGHSFDCTWNSQEWVTVCSGAPTLFGAEATTFGGVVNTQYSYDDFLGAYEWRLLAHEVKHTDQWSIFGPSFAILDPLAAGGGWVASKVFGGQPAQYNIFEIWAGLKDGGYTS